MKLPKIPRLKERAAQRIDTFEGLNLTDSIALGELSDALNMSSSRYPALAPSPIFERVGQGYEISGICCGQALAFVSGRYLYYDGVIMPSRQLAKGEKSLVPWGKKIFIFPDKLIFDSQSLSFEDMECERVLHEGIVLATPCLKSAASAVTVISSEKPSGSVSELSGTFWYDSSTVPGRLMRYVAKSASEGDFAEVTPDCVKLTVTDLEGTVKSEFIQPFEVGEGVTLSGAGPAGACLVGAGLHTTLAICEKSDSYLVLDGLSDGVLTAVLTGNSESDFFSIKRQVPDLEMAIAGQNRIYGCDAEGQRIYASRADCPSAFYGSLSSSDDPFYIESGSAGSFTALALYQDRPVFFKENALHKVLGRGQSVIKCEGVPPAYRHTLCEDSSALYYLSRGRVMKYCSSGLYELSSKLGLLSPDSASAELYGGKYYLCKAESNSSCCMVYDLQRQLWQKLESPAFSRLWQESGELHGISADGEYALDELSRNLSLVNWFFESGDLCGRSLERRAPRKISLKCAPEMSGRADVYIMYDKNGDYIFAGSLDSQVCTLTFTLRRCDSVKLRIEGRGELAVRCAEIS